MIPIDRDDKRLSYHRKRRKTAEQIARADERHEQDHLRWWKSIFDPYGIRVIGFTVRDTAIILDQDGISMRVTGSFARSIQRGPST